MVNLRNTEAIEYVRSLLPAEDYKLKVEPLDAKTLQLILSTHTNLSRPSEEPQSDSTMGDRQQTQEGINEQPTLIVDRPHELTLLETDAVSAAAVSPTPTPMPSPPPPSPSNFNEQPTFIVDNPNDVTSDIAPKSDPPVRDNVSAAEPTSRVESPFKIQNYTTKESLSFFANLPPQKLWQELLSRTIREGIGRLYFERHPHHGRIFWSKNGVLQLSLEKIKPSIFQEILNEFKRLMQLPSAPVKQARKGELERHYRQERLLMRWQIIPGKYGEEGTLQVLRGKASQLYQQRQMEELSSQALRMAEGLELKLTQIEVLSKINPTNLENLPVLRRLLEKINRHIESLDKD
jgi:type II secretory ATPase GspE/PulE/Tfp pilus assembly ATPase PilB-like protein